MISDDSSETNIDREIGVEHIDILSFGDLFTRARFTLRSWWTQALSMSINRHTPYPLKDNPTPVPPLMGTHRESHFIDYKFRLSERLTTSADLADIFSKLNETGLSLSLQGK